MGSGKGIDDFGRTGSQNLDIGVGRKGGLNTIENILVILVSSN